MTYSNRIDLDYHPQRRRSPVSAVLWLVLLTLGGGVLFAAAPGAPDRASDGQDAVVSEDWHGNVRRSDWSAK